MLFQTLDSKQECVGIYTGIHNNGTLLFGEDAIPDCFGGTHTWSYASYLEGYDIEYAYLYCGLGLDEVCPEPLRNDWQFVNARLQAFVRSFVEAKISLDDNCFFDLVPERFLKDYCYMKDQICKFVFENYDRPVNYDHLLATNSLIHKIAFQKLKLNSLKMKKQMHRKSIREQVRKLRNVQPYCKYNLFGTKTGRLTTRKNSFPILTLPKELRSIIQPRNHFFVSFDFNGAELRTLVALGGSEQPLGDIHEWNRCNVYRKIGSREKAKKRFFSWLYNPDSKDHLSSRFYDRESVLKECWDGTTVTTIYGRQIEVDKRKALNYLIQSTTSDMVMEQAVKLDEFLKTFKSNIAFVIHDEVVLDMDRNEMHLLKKMQEIFADTRLGTYMVGVKEGSDYGIAA